MSGFDAVCATVFNFVELVLRPRLETLEPSLSELMSATENKH